MMELPRWVPVFACVALGATIWLAAMPAAASVTTVKSTVTIVSGEGSGFTGKVGSARARCKAGRTVKLFREADSTRAAGQLVGTAKTSSSGAWTMDGSFVAGVFYAQVLPALVHINGMAYRCGGDFSLRQHY